LGRAESGCNVEKTSLGHLDELLWSRCSSGVGWRLMRRVTSRRSRRQFAAAISAAAISAATLLPVSAASATTDTKPAPSPRLDSRVVKPSTPPGFPKEIWDESWGPTDPAWTPHGTVVADSGFTPWPDGFHFFNYGDGLGNLLTQSSTGTNQPPTSGPTLGMTPSLMKRMFGKRVCAGLTRKGSCVLNPAAESEMKEMNESANGGHCFGFSTLSALLYNGSVSPKRYGSQAFTATSALPFSTKIQRDLTYWQSTQFAVSNSQFLKRTPSGVVSQLKAGLKKGYLPYALVMFYDVDGAQAGHAITPYALTDRGAGIYDIAVYDNNYPARARAVHVDTNANTWAYKVMTRPGIGAIVATGGANTFNLGLVPVKAMTGSHAAKCNTCGLPGETQVVMGTTDARHPVIPSITDKAGKPIPGVQTEAPLTPPDGDHTQAMPSFLVPKGVEFVVRLDGSRVKSTQKIQLQAAGSGQEVELSPIQVRAGTRVAITVNPNKGTSAVVSNKSNKTNLHVSRILKGPDIEAFASGLALAAGKSVATQVNTQKGTITLINSGKKTSFRLSLVGYTNKKTSAAGLVTVAAGGSVRVAYKIFLKKGTPPRAIVRSASGKVTARVSLR